MNISQTAVSFVNMDNRELIEIASKAEWTLECDRKVLEMMQNLASKIERRAANTKGKMNEMVLSLDETKVKMSNLTRINDIKNTVYCENLITDDHFESIQEVPKNTTVKLSTNIAIQNGLKLMENSFERHRVNLDPSSNRSEVATVYRPIDKFYSPLPYLIGEKNWKEKWHLGLIEEDKQSQAGSTYAESVESNTTPNSRLDSDLLASESNLMASQTSLTKSTSSIGDQMIINKQSGLFEEVYASEQPTPSITQPSTTFFAPQPAERKIVNLFDDEPPELTVESSQNRKPVNLFDDIDSVASMPIEEPEPFEKPLPPVDLFNDSEFDSFIRKMETEKVKNQTETPKKQEIVKEEHKTNTVQANMKNIAAEIKNVQLRKAENVSTVTKTVPVPQPDKKVVERPVNKNVDKKEQIKSFVKTEEPKIQEVPTRSEISTPVNPVKSKQKIANLFDDDDDDTDDFFNEIIKQKTQNNESKLSLVKKEEPVVFKQALEKKKNINLFDDEDDDDFESIFNKKLTISTPKIDKSVYSKKAEDLEKKLHDMSSSDSMAYHNENSSSQTVQKPSETYSDNEPQMIDKNVMEKRHKKLFDDDDEEDNENTNNISQSHSVKSTSEKAGQEVIRDIGQENKPEQMGNYFSFRSKVESNEVDESNAVITTPHEYKNIVNQSIDNEIKEDDLLRTEKSDKLIIANCPEDDKADHVPNVDDDTENQNIIIESNQIKKNVEHETRADNDISNSNSSHSSQFKEVSNPIAFLRDEPPDDDEYWDTEENNFEEPEEREVLSHQTSNYLAFNEVPPDDDYIGEAEKDLVEDSHIEDDIEDFLLQDSNKNEPSKTINFDETDSENEIFKPKSNIVKISPIDSKSEPERNIAQKSIERLFDDDSLPEIPVKKDINIFTQKQETDDENHKPEPHTVEEKRNIFVRKLEVSENISKSSNPAHVKDEFKKSNIRSKLDIFTKPQEQKSPSQQDSPPKKLPGKLNTNIKINVGALMPGARMPKKLQSEDSSESFDKSSSIEEPDSLSSSDKSLLVSENSSKENEVASRGLLNNEITKSRAKIQVKRRPQTRNGRQKNYQQSLNASLNEEEFNKNKEENFDNVLNTVREKTKPEVNEFPSDVMQSSALSSQGSHEKNLEEFKKIESSSHDLKIKLNIPESKSIDRVDNHKQVTVKTNKLNIFDDEPPPLENFDYTEQNVTSVTSKSRIFYDDEDETRQMLAEEKKRQENIESQSRSQQLFDKDEDNDLFGGSKNVIHDTNTQQPTEILKKSKNTSLFDDDGIFDQKNTQKSETLKKSKDVALFDDDSDNDLFTSKKGVEKLKKADITKKNEAPKSLFKDIDEDDDLFGSSLKKSIPDSLTKPKNKSIFGDDEDEDDDDLFSSKSKSTTSTLKTTPSTIVKKATSTVVNDPLKDLLEK